MLAPRTGEGKSIQKNDSDHNASPIQCRESLEISRRGHGLDGAFARVVAAAIKVAWLRQRRLAQKR
jgi:hypothetical protein